MKKGFILLSIAMLLPVLAVLLFYYIRQYNRMLTLEIETEEQLGFDRYSPNNHEKVEQGLPEDTDQILRRIEPQALFDDAGFESGDLLVQNYYEFYRNLWLYQNQEIAIPIIREGNSMEIHVFIPELELSFDPCDIRRIRCER